MHAFTEKGVQLWTRKICAQSVWRFYGEYDADDLMSEAWLVFDRVAKKYGDITIKHFMSLYQKSLINQFHRLAKQSRYRENLCDIDDAMSLETPAKTIVAMLADAPPDVRDAIIALMEADPVLLAEHPRRRRETYDERFHRIIENAPKDIATKIRDFLRSDDYVTCVNHSPRISHV